MPAPHQDTPAGADFGMTDLEEALRGPEGSAIRQDSIERLARMSARLESELDRGAPPDRYDRLKAMQIAVATASRILAINPSHTSSQGEH